MSILEATVAGGGGARLSVEPNALPAPGAAGVASSVLRPSGRVTIDGEPFDAVSSEGFIEAGTAIRVTGHQGESLLVERAT